MIKNDLFIVFFSLLMMILFNSRAYALDNTLSVEISHNSINENSLFGDFNIKAFKKKLNYHLNFSQTLNNIITFNSNIDFFVQEDEIQEDEECKFNYYINNAYLTYYFNDSTIIELGKNNLYFGNSLVEDILNYNTNSKTSYWMVNAKKYFDNLGIILLYIPSYNSNLSSEWVNAIDDSQTYFMISYNLLKNDIRALYKVNNKDPFIALSVSRAFEKLWNTIFYLDTKIISYDTKYSLSKTNYFGIDYYYIEKTAFVKDYFNPFILGMNWSMFNIADCRLEYVKSDYSLSIEDQKIFWENLESNHLIFSDFDKKNLISTHYLNLSTTFIQAFKKTDIVFNLKYNLDDNSSIARLVFIINLNTYSININTAKTFAPSNKSEFGSYPFESEFSISLSKFF